MKTEEKAYRPGLKVVPIHSFYPCEPCHKKWVCNGVGGCVEKPITIGVRVCNVPLTISERIIFPAVRAWRWLTNNS
jgi:hypothetical protein